MRFQTPLQPGVLLRRYKRFLADIRLEDGREITAHCANPGAMLGLTEPGCRVWVEPVADPRRKLRFAWRFLDFGAGRMVGVDTGLPNKLVGEALRARQIAELVGYETVLAEQRYGEKSRVDFLLRGGDQPDAYVEVKSVTLCRDEGRAEFPDSVTERGARHLRDLADMARQGYRAVLFYVVQRTDCTLVTVARDLDPTYAAAMDDALAAGVEVIARDVAVTPDDISLRNPLPFERS
ncbi:MAG: DNA/RNA nuclease SfsA [Pseudomonadota bacterium]